MDGNPLDVGRFGRKEQSRDSDVLNWEGQASSSAVGASFALEFVTVSRFPSQECLSFNTEMIHLELPAMLILPILIPHLVKLAKHPYHLKVVLGVYTAFASNCSS